LDGSRDDRHVAHGGSATAAATIKPVRTPAHFGILNDFIVPSNPIRRAVYLMSAGRRLRKRLDAEAQRRGQTVPRFADLGFSK
jgi:hypothetical protein